MSQSKSEPFYAGQRSPFFEFNPGSFEVEKKGETDRLPYLSRRPYRDRERNGGWRGILEKRRILLPRLRLRVGLDAPAPIFPLARKDKAAGLGEGRVTLTSRKTVRSEASPLGL